MGCEWRDVALGDLIKIKHGYAFKGEYFCDEQTPDLLLTPGNFAIGGGFQLTKPKYYSGPVPDDYILKPGDIVVTMTDLSKAADTLGYGAVVPKNKGVRFLHNQRIGLVESITEVVDLLFVSYLMRTNNYRQWVIGSSSGSTVKHTSPSRILAYQFSLPTLPEQRSIASILSSLDDRIALLHETNTTLEAIAQAIFKSWFVDFDPVKAKAEGREPEGMDAETAALFPSEFEESELGMIPKEWRVGTLGDAMQVFDSKRVPLSSGEREKRKGIYPYYGAASMMDRVDDYLFDGVYLLMGEDGSVINTDGTPVIQYVWGKFWVNNHAHVIKGKNDICTEHVMLHLKNCNITPYITGAVQLKLNQGNMNRINIVLPTANVSHSFSEQIATLYEKIRHNAEQSQTLASLRDTLLPRLMSGQLRVPEAEQMVEGAV